MLSGQTTHETRSDLSAVSFAAFPVAKGPYRHGHTAGMRDGNLFVDVGECERS
jgi:hypothetical protein